MFRKPRENVTATLHAPYKPATGRPPTPPSSTSYRDSGKSIDTSSVMASSPVPLLGRSRTLPRSNGRTHTSPVTISGKSKGKPNGSILSFFKKTDLSATSNGNGCGNDSGENVNTLFFGGDITNTYRSFARPRSPTPDDLYGDPLGPSQQSPTNSKVRDQDLEGSRYHENGASVKRRRFDSVSAAGKRVDNSESNNASEVHQNSGRSSVAENEAIMLEREGCTPPPFGSSEPVLGLSKHTAIQFTDKSTDPGLCAHTMSEAVAGKDKRRIGPFIEDSDSDEDVTKTIKDTGGPPVSDWEAEKSAGTVVAERHRTEQNGEDEDQSLNLPKIPALKQESTSVRGDDGFDNIEDFVDDEFAEEGEEYIERRWIEEQRRVELGLEDEGRGELAEGSMETATEDERLAQSGGAAPCPICAVNLSGITDTVRRYICYTIDDPSNV